MYVASESGAQMKSFDFHLSKLCLRKLLPHFAACPGDCKGPRSFPQRIFSNCDVQPVLRNLDVELWDYASPRSQKLRHATQAIARPGHSLDSQFGTPARPPRLHELHCSQDFTRNS